VHILATSKYWCNGIVLIIVLTAACAWRSGEAEHYMGPILFRIVQPPEGRAYITVVQSLLPLSIEAGEHNGLTLGLSRRVSSNPVNGTSSPVQWCRWPNSCSKLSTQDGWSWSLLYLQIERKKVVEFLDKQFVGASFGIGTEGRFLTIGYSAITYLQPGDNAFYILCYGREQPLLTHFAAVSNINDYRTLLKSEVCK
jgi:hypothetical protein